MDLDKSFYSLSVEETFKSLESSADGLNQREVRRRRDVYGRNRLEEQEKESILNLLLSQFNNPVVYLLLAAVIVSLIFSDIPEAIAIAVVILLNTGIGFWMEFRAQSSLEALKKMDPLTTRAVRNGQVKEIRASELVPGDLLYLEAGDMVPADARIVSGSEIKIDESPLTGESVPVTKQTDPVQDDTPLADRTNMVFKGTALTHGKARAIAVATGMNTEIGGISKMVSEAEKEKIPLNKKLGKLARRLIWIILGLSALFFLFGWLAGKEIYLLLQTAIAWSVAAIPEGLPIVASISLARGMLRLARRNVIVNRLASVETLGETNVILTDKTGTLTKNQLTLDTVETAGRRIELEKDEYPVDEEGFGHLFNVFVFCNDASRKNGDYKGDPLDIALLQFVRKHDEKKHQALLGQKRIHEDPFDSEDMFMGTIHSLDNTAYISAKGATAVILDRCIRYFDGGKTRKINKAFREEWIGKDRELSANGLKVIGFAFKETSLEEAGKLNDQDDFVKDLVFLGIAGFIDPVRSDIAASIETCHRSGIRVVMVTGDHPETAMNIAGKVNLITDGGETVIHGQDLDGRKDITKASVFARVDPSQKLDIVEQFQKEGSIVGMTGDGVNDAPALKKADIGIAMGKRGTQLAREVADMVLKDDSFPSIVKAIEQGRVIFENIKKFIIYQLSYHLAEIIIIAGISFTMFRLPLFPLQLLFLNLLSDVFPALALGVGKGSRKIMEKKPKDPIDPIITRKDWYLTGLYGLVISVFVIGAYVYASFIMQLPEGICNNIAFFSLAFGQLLHVFDMREADEPVLINQVTRNRYIWLALGFCIAVLLAGYFIPVLHEVLSFERFGYRIWGLIILTSLLPLVTNQAIKKIWKL